MADIQLDYRAIVEASDEQLEEINKKVNVPSIVMHDENQEISTIASEEEKPPSYSVTDNQTLTKSENDLEFLQESNKNTTVSEYLVKKENTESKEIADQESEEEDLLIGDTLSPFDKLVKFSNSSLVLQRLVITREIPAALNSISIEEAVNTALPIIIQLGRDPEDSVREALASELDKIICFYYNNAPPFYDSIQQDDTHLLHIPSHAFATTIIEFLLDQNTTLASIAQQSIVTVASELAETAEDAKEHKLHQTLLDQEIFQGVVCGLISIFNENVEDNDEIIDSYKDNDGDKASKQLDEDDNVTAVVEKITSSTEATAKPSSPTSTVLKNYDNGGMNLAKMVCLMLISALAPVFGPKRCEENILPIVESMAADQMFYVRKEAAAAVGSLSTVLTPDITLERLLPLYRKLSVDTIWHVRRSCVFALPLLADTLPKDMKAAIAVEGVELFQNDASRNVRNSLADIMGELISKFLPEDWKETGKPGEVPERLLDFFISMGNLNTTGTNQMFKLDIERIHNCAYNFPAVVLTAGVGYWDHLFKDTYLNLTKDYQLKVRRTFAYSLHEIARIIGPERTERDLVQIFALYLMDLDDVKQGVLEHLSEFLSVLAVSSRNDYIPILAEVWDGVLSNWHLRNILTDQLRGIARLFDASRVVEHILPLALRACHDEFAAVRESGAEIFPVILDIVKHEVDENGENLSHVEIEGETDESDDLFERQQKYALALLRHVMEKLDELVVSYAYRTRLVFTQICKLLLEAGISPTDFASFFLPRLTILAKDHIVNVRIATARTIQTLCCISSSYRQELEAISFSEEGQLNPGETLDEILYYLATDSEEDVRYFVEELVAADKLDVYRKRREVEELEIAQQQKLRESNKEEPTFPLPPTPPAHLITQSSEYQSDAPRDEEILAPLREESTSSAIIQPMISPTTQNDTMPVQEVEKRLNNEADENSLDSGTEVTPKHEYPETRNADVPLI